MRRTGERQLTFAFADSPQGDKGATPPDESGGRVYLLRIAKGTRAQTHVAVRADRERMLELVASPHNLASALLKVAGNKGSPGVDGISVEEVVAESACLLPRLCRSLLCGDYRPGDIRRVWIPKPGGGQRGLGIPNVVDRWVQQALHQVLEPVFDPGFHDNSHGFRPFRGAHTAIARAKSFVLQGKQFVVDMDLSKFFDRVNHQRLLSRVGLKVSDRRILDLIRLMLKAGVVLPDGTRVATDEGTPQGGPLSPLLSNIVLDELDWELERRGHCFVRYADDCNVFVGSERAGKRVMASIRRFIEGRLKLLVNEEKSAVARCGERHFLGFRLCPLESGEVEVHVSKRTKERMDARIRELTPRNWGNSLEACIKKLNAYLDGWLGYFRICTGSGATLFKRFDAHIRRRLRAIIIHQKKRPRHLYRHLLHVGASSGAAAQAAFYGKGVWRRSNSRGLTMAYPNSWFHARLTSLWEHWLMTSRLRTVSGQLLLFDE